MRGDVYTVIFSMPYTITHNKNLFTYIQTQTFVISWEGTRTLCFSSTCRRGISISVWHREEERNASLWQRKHLHRREKDLFYDWEIKATWKLKIASFSRFSSNFIFIFKTNNPRLQLCRRTPKVFKEYIKESLLLLQYNTI